MSNEDTLRAYLKRATGELVSARQRVRELEAGAAEPIAIVGMACRYPGGATSPDLLWDLVNQGKDTVSGLPVDRGWDPRLLAGLGGDARESAMGAFLDGVADFDAEFFGITPREALAMDPEQRLVLEVSWEALEHAGIDPTGLRGGNTGVFIGANSSYGNYVSGSHANIDAVAGYLLTGNVFSAISGRVSYVFGFTGPAITLDTACSSSLVAMHLAAQSLRSDESGLALVGGVRIISTPEVFAEFARQDGLAADGRCKSFADAADGTGFADGVGMLVLERLSDARRLGHRVLALLLGSAVNQDGASNGLTAPSGPAQERVIRAALASARVSAVDVDVVEAHGTGTRLGDPIEAQAVLATYGQGRPAGRPVYLGSLKSNIGHTQAAAGVAGVIKMVMAMRHGVLPRTLHIDRPTTHVDWAAGAVELLTEDRRWPETGRSRRAAVSSFGISGTNAHVILEQAPVQPDGEPSGDSGPGDKASAVVPWLVSARSATALRAQAGRLLTRLDDATEWEETSVAHALATERAALEHRAVVLGADKHELLAALRAVADGRSHPHALSSRARAVGDVAFVFAGQGAQRVGMGRGLCAGFPVFARVWDEVCRLVDGGLPAGLSGVVFGLPDADADADADAGSDSGWGVDGTVFAQPALFGLEVGLFRLVESWGVRPDVVAGHSVGEVAAAHVAGVLSLEDACRLVVARGRLMQALPAGGGMAAVEAGEAEVAEVLAGLAGVGVSVAAVNAPRSVVLSGELAGIERVAGVFAARGRRVRRLRVSHAFHSPLMEPMLEEFRRVVEGLSFKPATIPAVSTVTGGHTDAWSEPGYWVEQVRATVRYAEAVHTLTTHGATTVLEIGPDTTLTTLTHHCLDHNTDGVHDTAADTHRQVLVLPALRDPDDEVTSVLAAVGRLWTEGVEVDRGALVPSPRADARRLDLPTYAFQRERFWLDADVSAGDVGAAGLAAVGHPLLGAVTELPAAGGLVLSGRVSCGTHRWLADHRVAGAVLFPGTAFLELARCAGEQAGRYRVEELTLESPLAIGEAEVIHLSVGLDDPDEQGRRAVWIFSRHERSAPGDGEPWVRHATGVLVPDEPAEDTAEPEAPAAVWPPAGAVRVDVGGVYEGFAGAGVEYGPVFQGLRGVWRSGGVVFAEVGLPEEEAGRAGGFGVHPALLDAALQAAVFCEAGSGSVVGRVPFSWRGVRWHARGARVLRVRLVSEGEGRLRLSAVDPVGAPVIDIGELDLRELDRSTITAPVPVTPDGLFRLGWVPLDAGESLVSAPVAAVLVDSSLGAAADAGGMRAVPSLAETVGAAGGTAPEVVVVRVPAHEGADVPAAVRAGTAGVLALMQEFVADDRFARSRLMLLTEGAVTVEDTDRISIPAAAVWGLVRSAQLEHPGRFVLVDTDGRPVAPGALSAAVGSATSELAVRDGRVCVPRLTGVPRAASTPVGPLGSGVVVVSGGLGGLGGVVARHVVTAYGVRDVVLVSRRGERSPGAAELVAELSGLGARVAVVAADVSDRAQVADVAAQITRDRRLSAVLHVAGVVDDGVIGALSPSRLDAVLGPKLDGGWWWHEVTSGLLLDAFVVFSSASGVLGSAGQGNYAAANAAVEALAVHRRSLGLPGVSIAWGLWEQSTGITAGLSERDRARMASAGMAGLSTEHALRLLDAALAGADPAVTAIALDPARINTTDTTVPYLLRQLTPRTQPATAAGNAESYRHQLAAMSRDEQTDALVRLVRGHAAAVLGHSAPDAVRTDQPFQEMGFDSLGVVKLRNALSRVTGVALPASLAFDHPNVAALAAHLRELLIPARRTGEAEAEEQLIRRALQEIPLTRLREAGLMDNLLELAGLESSAAAREDEAADLTTGIENMDAQSLITLALGGAADDDVEDTTR